MTYKISLIGIGFVGSAMLKSFQLKGVDVIGYDKFKNGGIGSLEECLESDICFMALPTVFNEQLNQYDKKPIYENCEIMQEKGYKGVIVIKSTVEPETTKILSRKFKGLKFIHNPEFLTARTAFEDFHYQSHIVIGVGENCCEEDGILVKDFFAKHYQNTEISVCTSDESESMKIFVNCFYSVKVQFFNELYLSCKNIGCDYNRVKELMLKNGWINPMHTDVPGSDGQLSYGGLCFPKDTNALNQFMKNKDIPNKVLDATIKERNEMRGDTN